MEFTFRMCNIMGISKIKLIPQTQILSAVLTGNTCLFNEKDILVLATYLEFWSYERVCIAKV